MRITFVEWLRRNRPDQHFVMEERRKCPICTSTSFYLRGDILFHIALTGVYAVCWTVCMNCMKMTPVYNRIQANTTFGASLEDSDSKEAEDEQE